MFWLKNKIINFWFALLSGGLFYLFTVAISTLIFMSTDFDLILYVPVNNFSVMLGQVFLG